jgi:hypothetical protein
MTSAPRAARSTPASRRTRWIKASLATSSFLFTVFALEIVTRLVVPAPAPVLLRDGIYVSNLGKVNGFDTRTHYVGRPLEAKKRPGEIRIAVFGESTVQGSPWESFGSPVTMLYDHLHEAMPDRDITVLNMGRGAGYTIDAYYFLVTLRRFAPDFVVFYQGANDMYDTDAEMCFPASHPYLHAAWRALVERSRLLWTVRAEGPAAFLRATRGPNAGRWQPQAQARATDRCDPEAGFRAWTEVLVETAKGMGAKVIVTTPSSNPLRWAELHGQYGRDGPLNIDEQDPHYRRMLECVLTPGCDIAAAWKADGSLDPIGSLFCLFERGCDTKRSVLLRRNETGQAYPPIVWLLPRVRISLEVAAAHGARSIDFHGYLEKNLERGLRPMVFVDEMHLTLEGLWLLSWFWTQQIANLLDGRTLDPLPPPLDRQRYLTPVMKDLSRGEPCIYLRTVPIFLRGNMPLVAAVQLRMALEADRADAGHLASTRAGLAAQVLAGWIRSKLGVDPAVPKELSPLFDDVNVQRLSNELSEHPDCSTAGGPRLEALVRDKSAGMQGVASPVSTGGERPEEPYVISRGQEAVIGAMLGAAKPGGCELEGAEVRGTFIHASYKCSDGRTVFVDLHHPTHTAGAVVTTGRFALVKGEPPPSDKLVADLAESLLKGEQSFVWTKPKSNVK